jgi:hypothetical protein
MKTIISFLLLLSFTVLISCQEEEQILINDGVVPSQNSLVKNSPFVKLLKRVSQCETGFDNVLDNSSCYSVQLPVSITINSQNIVVANNSDYQLIQNIKDASSTDDDIVIFTYPITLKFKDFSTRIVNNINQLNAVVADCAMDDGFSEIDCISINFPILVNGYNLENQIATSVTIQSKNQFYNFIANLNSSNLAAILYPISVKDSEGSNQVINNNVQFQNFIENSITQCDNSTVNVGSFVSVLTSNSWRVTYSYNDGEDNTEDYDDYVFAFNSNFSIQVVKNSSISFGNWSNYLDDNINNLELTFIDNNLDEIEEDWQIIEYSNITIRLKDDNSNSTDDDYLYLIKI